MTGCSIDIEPPAATYENVQSLVFDRGCHSAQCHKGPTAPLGLHLGPGASYRGLVNVSSAHGNGLLVSPGDADNSHLLDLLRGVDANDQPDPDNRMPPAPDDEVSQVLIDMVTTWISNGAPRSQAPTRLTVLNLFDAQDQPKTPLMPDRIQVAASHPLGNADASHMSLVDSNGVKVQDALAVTSSTTDLIQIDFDETTLPSGDYTLIIADSLTNTAAEPIDGDGDGAAGGTFRFEFQLSPLQDLTSATFTEIQEYLFTPYCDNCHSNDDQDNYGGLSLEAGSSYDELLNEAPARVEAGSPDTSLLIQRLEAIDGTEMPPGNPLPQAVIDIVRQWISDGATNP